MRMAKKVIRPIDKLTKLKYCPIMGAAGLEKFRLKEYSVEPR